MPHSTAPRVPLASSTSMTANPNIASSVGGASTLPKVIPVARLPTTTPAY